MTEDVQMLQQVSLVSCAWAPALISRALDSSCLRLRPAPPRFAGFAGAVPPASASATGCTLVLLLLLLRVTLLVLPRLGMVGVSL